MASKTPRAYHLLALCARAQGDDEFYHRLARKVAGLPGWEEMSALAEAQGMAPLLYFHLKGAEVNFPPPVKRELQGLYLRHRRLNQVRMRVLHDVLAAYRADGIPALVLKGAALCHLVYPEPGLRPMSDLDLLVPRSELWRAQRALAELGFDAPLPPNDRLSHRHLAAATLKTEGLSVRVEVHHKLFSDYFDHARARLRVTLRLPFGGPAQDAPALSGQSFALADLTAHTLGPEEMLGHLCRHLVSHVNAWDSGRLIWVADIVSFAERFVAELDWERLRRQQPAVMDTLSLLHFMTPLSDTLLKRAGIKIGRAPGGIGSDYQGWPRISWAKRRERGCRRLLRDTLSPPECWLRLRYKLGSARPLFWYRWLRHPFYILGHVIRTLLERMGWPAPLELAE